VSNFVGCAALSAVSELELSPIYQGLSNVKQFLFGRPGNGGIVWIHGYEAVWEL